MESGGKSFTPTIHAEERQPGFFTPEGQQVYDRLNAALVAVRIEKTRAFTESIRPHRKPFAEKAFAFIRQTLDGHARRYRKMGLGIADQEIAHRLVSIAEAAESCVEDEIFWAEMSESMWEGIVMRVAEYEMTRFLGWNSVSRMSDEDLEDWFFTNGYPRYEQFVRQPVHEWVALRLGMTEAIFSLFDYISDRVDRELEGEREQVRALLGFEKSEIGLKLTQWHALRFFRDQNVDESPPNAPAPSDFSAAKHAYFSRMMDALCLAIDRWEVGETSYEVQREIFEEAKIIDGYQGAPKTYQETLRREIKKTEVPWPGSGPGRPLVLEPWLKFRDSWRLWQSQQKSTK